VVAVTWLLFIIVVLMFPPDVDPTSTSMNYTVVVLGGWLLFSLVWYYLPVIGGKHFFTGPIVNVTDQMSLSSSTAEVASTEKGKEIFDVGKSKEA
jgi:hypothetical protein